MLHELGHGAEGLIESADKLLLRKQYERMRRTFKITTAPRRALSHPKVPGKAAPVSFKDERRFSDFQEWWAEIYADKALRDVALAQADAPTTLSSDSWHESSPLALVRSITSRA